MKRKWMAIVGAGILLTGGLVVVARTRAKSSAASSLSSPTAKLSYAMGVAVSRSLKRQHVDVEMNVMARGLKDALAGAKLLMTDEEMRDTISAFQIELKQRKVEAQAAVATADVNKQQGEAFLQENAKKEGVVRLPSGLQYKIQRAGQGRTPTDTDIVEVHYRGRRVDGSEFESSYERGPATFRMASLIPGWKEALQRMPVGSKWELFLPSELAYGERGLRGKKGMGRKIPPNTTLVFEIELLGTKPGQAIPGNQATAATVLQAAPGN